MSIAFHIPTWLLWVGGIIGGVIVLGLAALGVVLLSGLRNWGSGNI